MNQEETAEERAQRRALRREARRQQQELENERRMAHAEQQDSSPRGVAAFTSRVERVNESVERMRTEVHEMQAKVPELRASIDRYSRALKSRVFNERDDRQVILGIQQRVRQQTTLLERHLHNIPLLENIIETYIANLPRYFHREVR